MLDNETIRAEAEGILNEARRECPSFVSLWVANPTGMVVAATAVLLALRGLAGKSVLGVGGAK